MSKVVLSERQEQVLSMLIAGVRQQHIAFSLGLNHKTVHSHLRAAALKFGIEQLDRVHTEELIRCAKSYFDFVSAGSSTGDA